MLRYFFRFTNNYNPSTGSDKENHKASFLVFWSVRLNSLHPHQSRFPARTFLGKCLFRPSSLLLRPRFSRPWLLDPDFQILDSAVFVRFESLDLPPAINRFGLVTVLSWWDAAHVKHAHDLVTAQRSLRYRVIQLLFKFFIGLLTSAWQRPSPIVENLRRTARTAVSSILFIGHPVHPLTPFGVYEPPDVSCRRRPHQHQHRCDEGQFPAPGFSPV